jgi:hypothetical protein
MILGIVVVSAAASKLNFCVVFSVWATKLLPANRGGATLILGYSPSKVVRIEPKANFRVPAAPIANGGELEAIVIIELLNEV